MVETKELKQVVFDGAALETYKRLKTKLMMENDSEVLRFAVAFAEKRFK